MNKLIQLLSHHQTRLHKTLLFGTLVIILGLVNWQIYQKEQHLAHGTKVYLELAPVDPRSLMQGDYMALRFKIADDIRAALKRAQAQSIEAAKSNQGVSDTQSHSVASSEEQNIEITSEQWQSLPNSDGYVIVKIDENHIAHFQAIADAPDDGKSNAKNSGINSAEDSEQTLSSNALRIQYRVRQGQIKFATNAFFFQEGHASVYEAADYGEFRVNSHGEPLLTAMYDADLKKLEYREEGGEQESNN